MPKKRAETAFLRDIDYSPMCPAIPEGTRGKYAIEQEPFKAGRIFDAINRRNSFFLGIPPLQAKLMNPGIHHKLTWQGMTLASDVPNEIATQYLNFRHAHGKVLTAGLGVGLAPTRMVKMPKVEHVVVVEKSREVAELVWPHIKKERLALAKGDLFQFLESGEAKGFDFFYLDIWSPTGEGAWMEYIVPLRRLIFRKYGSQDVECWLEAEMVSQIQQGISTRLMAPQMWPGLNAEPSWEWKPYRVFKNALEAHPKADWEGLLDLYTSKVGTPNWEKIFKWDEVKK